MVIYTVQVSELQILANVIRLKVTLHNQSTIHIDLNSSAVVLHNKPVPGIELHIDRTGISTRSVAEPKVRKTLRSQRQVRTLRIAETEKHEVHHSLGGLGEKLHCPGAVLILCQPRDRQPAQAAGVKVGTEIKGIVKVPISGHLGNASVLRHRVLSGGVRPGGVIQMQQTERICIDTGLIIIHNRMPAQFFRDRG